MIAIRIKSLILIVLLCLDYASAQESSLCLAGEIRGSGIAENESDALDAAYAELAKQISFSIKVNTEFNVNRQVFNGNENLSSKYKSRTLMESGLLNASDARIVHKERIGKEMNITVCMSRENAAKGIKQRQRQLSDSLDIMLSVWQSAENSRERNDVWHKTQDLWNKMPYLPQGWGIANEIGYSRETYEKIKSNYMHWCQSQGKCRLKSDTLRVGIDVRNKEWSYDILNKISSNNRFDVYDRGIYKNSKNETDFDFAEQYDYAILASNYKKEWIRTDAGGYNLESMDVVIAQGKKTLKSYKAYCAQGDGKQGDHRDIFSSDYCVAEAFLKVAALKAHIVEINGKDIVISRGSNFDVKKYDEFKVLDSDYDEEIGKIRVKKVGSETAVAEKIRGKISESSILEQTEPFSLNSWYLMISGASLVSQKYPKEQAIHISGLLGFEYISRISQWGGGLFFGGGGLSADGGIGEVILGGDVKRLVWIANERVALMPSVGLAWRFWVGSLNADVVSEISKADEMEIIVKNSFDIMPAMDLQFFLSESFSLFAGYMYRLAISGDWNFDYKVDGYDGYKTVYVPDEYAPTKKDAKASIGIPGVLRAGVKWHP